MEKLTSRLLLFLMMVAIALCSGCVKRSLDDKRAFAVFSSDFSLAGSGTPQDFTEKDGQLDTTKVVAHGETPLPLPTDIVVGKQYVFHYHGRLNGYDLGVSELPLRLRQEGIQDVDAPRSAKDMMWLYVGGPLFRIKFRQGTHRGMIFTQICRDFKTDYVLVYLN